MILRYLLRDNTQSHTFYFAEQILCPQQAYSSIMSYCFIVDILEIRWADSCDACFIDKMAAIT